MKHYRAGDLEAWQETRLRAAALAEIQKEKAAKIQARLRGSLVRYNKKQGNLVEWQRQTELKAAEAAKARDLENLRREEEYFTINKQFEDAAIAKHKNHTRLAKYERLLAAGMPPAQVKQKMHDNDPDLLDSTAAEWFTNWRVREDSKAAADGAAGQVGKLLVGRYLKASGMPKEEIEKLKFPPKRRAAMHVAA